jgi:hypothetical protein
LPDLARWSRQSSIHHFNVSIKLTRTATGYEIEVTPSPRLPEQWFSNGALTQHETINRLVAIGYHLQDIADALHFADQKWAEGDDDGQEATS